MSADNDASRLDVSRQTKYFLRCLKSLLPAHYIPTDSNRMALAFYTISALDLLDALDTHLQPAERKGYIDWVYLTQHPDGGFRGFTGGCGSAHRHQHNHDDVPDWDPANVSATYFALCILLILGDDLARVDRTACATWLPRLQRSDGGFGETLVDGVIHGGHDPRFGYCAAGICYILGLNRNERSQIGNSDGAVVDVDAFVRYTRAAETYDGGIAGRPLQEAHAGFTFCAIAALDLFDRLRPSKTDSPHDTNISGLSDPARTVHWLVSRQTTEIYKPDPDSDPLEDDLDDNLDDDKDDSILGVNGRINKQADTCYAFWVLGSLSVLNDSKQPYHTKPSTTPDTTTTTDSISISTTISTSGIKKWLLNKTANALMGGFGKHAGDLPDLHHSYLGLAACGLLGVQGVEPLDAAMCVSARTRRRVPSVWQQTWGL